jgi:HD-GYP domain-containing protein (c-di-GMP phosphodiesterase class II)
MDHDIVSAMVRAVELKDSSTAAHTWRVGFYTQALAEEAGVPTVEIPRYIAAAVMHDIGKIDIPGEILSKPGRLTDDEFSVMSRHSLLGYERLKRMGETDELVLALVRSHHEREDGTGYPEGLAGDAIPRAARFFAVIDSFDAMTSLRPYRREVGADAARRAITELRSLAGVRYDAHAVEMFSKLYETGRLDWILSYMNGPESLVDLPSAPGSDAVMAEARRRTPPRRADAPEAALTRG